MGTKEKVKETAKAKSSELKQTSQLIIKNFFDHDVLKSAAALAYNLLFAVFPLLIFLSNLLGVLDLNINAIIQVLYNFLPNDIVGLVENYLDYISHTSSEKLLVFSLIFSVWFPMRAVKGLMDDVRLAYQLEKPRRAVIYTIRQFLYTIVFLLAIALTLLLTIFGRNVITFIIDLVPADIIDVSDYMLRAWQYLRFLPVGLLMIAAIGMLYAGSLDNRQPIKTIIPGIALALIGWMIVTVGFSFYVEHFESYTIIYGTLGAVILLLIWLYMTALILILGAELNAALITVRSRNKELKS